MKSFGQKLLKAFSVLPSIILAAENLFGAKSGQTKKEFVDSIISTIIGQIEAIANKDIINDKDFLDNKDKMIEAIVGMFKAAGII